MLGAVIAFVFAFATLGLLAVIEWITIAEFQEYGMRSVLAILILSAASFAISSVLGFLRSSKQD
jgi:hypothetical protein